ncbi:Uncharacterised protein [[Clostridium] symbiosum]|nr:Uncharacterised protein [[Clostridium] symbiosum]
MFRGSLLMAVTCARCVQVIVIRCTVKVNTGFLFCVKSLGTYQQKNLLIIAVIKGFGYGFQQFGIFICSGGYF